GVGGVGVLVFVISSEEGVWLDAPQYVAGDEMGRAACGWVWAGCGLGVGWMVDGAGGVGVGGGRGRVAFWCL
nr:hypothetical protein [Pseudomonadota bacterium]